MAGTDPGNGEYLRIFDVDAQAELRRVPLAEVRACPRIGETIHLAAQREHSGGMYSVLGVIHQVADGSEQVGNSIAHLAGIVVEVKPRHEREPEAAVTSVEVVVSTEAIKTEATSLMEIAPLTEPDV